MQETLVGRHFSLVERFRVKQALSQLS